jgi:hypothetical protein
VGIERARRLLGAIASTSAETVAVAAPELGADIALARAVENARIRNRSGREITFVRFLYAPGRRNYGPEARRFKETGADAIVLCGQTEESTEWVLALSAARLRPQVFGASGLDPRGFHETARRALEGAVYVGSEWSAVGSLRARLESARAAAARPADDKEFDRGFLTGASLARRIVVGNCTPGLLADALTDESPEDFGMVLRMLNPGDVPADPGPPTAEVPLFLVRNGAGVRFEVN